MFDRAAYAERKKAQAEHDAYRQRHPQFLFEGVAKESLSVAAEWFAAQADWSLEHGLFGSFYFRHQSGALVRVSDHPVVHAKCRADAYVSAANASDPEQAARLAVEKHQAWRMQHGS